jgi:CRP-like cAMP-binding protein
MEERSALFEQVSFCQGLDPATIRALAMIAVPLHCEAGAVIQLMGDPAEVMYVVLRGHVKIARMAANGREQVLHTVAPGQHFNGVPIFDGGVCPANAEALTDVALLALPGAGLRRVVEEHPSLALALLREFTGRLRYVVNLVDDLALHTVQGRLARLLLAQAEAAERGETMPALTQADIAARLGTVREMVGRTLKGFEVQGLIRLDRGVITLLDRQGLAAQGET